MASHIWWTRLSSIRSVRSELTIPAIPHMSLMSSEPTLLSQVLLSKREPAQACTGSPDSHQDSLPVHRKQPEQCLPARARKRSAVSPCGPTLLQSNPSGSVG